MNKLVFLFSVLAISNFASAATMNDIVGSYKISNPNFPVIDIVTINADSTVKLTEQSPYGKLECSGKASLKLDVITSAVKCDNGKSFTQKINLKNVTNFTNFLAPVYSSLYDQEVGMHFERLE